MSYYLVSKRFGVVAFFDDGVFVLKRFRTSKVTRPVKRFWTLKCPYIHSYCSLYADDVLVSPFCVKLAKLGFNFTALSFRTPLDDKVAIHTGQA